MVPVLWIQLLIVCAKTIGQVQHVIKLYVAFHVLRMGHVLHLIIVPAILVILVHYVNYLIVRDVTLHMVSVLKLEYVNVMMAGAPIRIAPNHKLKQPMTHHIHLIYLI
jgi:hypothetical protein